jgi:hypothetical protein
MLDGTGLYYLGTTLQVERCARDVADGHTLPVSSVINDPYLLVIHPRDCEGRDDRYHGHGQKKPVHLESPPTPSSTRQNLLGGIEARFAIALRVAVVAQPHRIRLCAIAAAYACRIGQRQIPPAQSKAITDKNSDFFDSIDPIRT